MSEQYFFVRKLGLGKEVVSLSLVVTEVSRGGGMRWWRQEVGLQISRGSVWQRSPSRIYSLSLRRVWHIMSEFTSTHYRSFRRRVLSLRFDRRSTPIRLQFDRATTFDDLRYDRRPACVRTAALRSKWINRSAWLGLAGCVTVTLMTFQKQLNGRQIEVESCNQCVSRHEIVVTAHRITHVVFRNMILFGTWRLLIPSQ